MRPDVYVLWTERGLCCRVLRAAEGWHVTVEAAGSPPFLRRFAHSQGDANNQAEYVRVLLDRSRDGVRAFRDRQPLVLIVEDDPENLIAYEETLRVDGFRTVSAITIAEARRHLRAVSPAAVLLDHVLPDGSGPDFCRELRAALPESAVPIVLVTGLDPREVASAYDGGPDAMLGKPVRPETLTGVLKLLVQRAKPARPRARPAEPLEPLARARCPLCGTAGALVESTGLFHCQHCGKEEHVDRVGMGLDPESLITRL